MRLTATVAAALLLGACAPHTPPTYHPAVVLIQESNHTTIDVSPPQRLDVIMAPDGVPTLRCLDLGGEPIYYPNTHEVICEGVDY